MVAFVPAPGQLPLIQFVESDDLYLQDQPDVLWADVLPNLDYRRFQPTAAHYYQKLCENPAFARTCGFTIRRPEKRARQSDVPSLRKLQQFDQIMTHNGLWAELALDQVADNLRNGTLRAESTEKET